jgi:hypothetical protein
MRGLERRLARFLRSRGWIVFWLDEPARFCAVGQDPHGADCFRPGPHQGCWLALYVQQETAGKK